MEIFNNTWTLWGILLAVNLYMDLCAAAPTLRDILGRAEGGMQSFKKFRTRRSTWDGLYFFPTEARDGYEGDRVGNDGSRANRERRHVELTDVEDRDVEVKDPHVLSVVKRKITDDGARIDPGVIHVLTRSTTYPVYDADNRADTRAAMHELKKREAERHGAKVDPDVIEILKRSTGRPLHYYTRILRIDPGVIEVGFPHKRLLKAKSLNNFSILRLDSIDPDVIRVRRGAKHENNGLFHPDGWLSWFTGPKERSHERSRQRRETETDSDNKDEQNGLFHPVGWERFPY